MSINRKDHSSININNVYKGPRTHTHTHTYIGHKLQMLKGEKWRLIFQSQVSKKGYLNSWILYTTELQEIVYLQIIYFSSKWQKSKDPFWQENGRIKKGIGILIKKNIQLHESYLHSPFDFSEVLDMYILLLFIKWLKYFKEKWKLNLQFSPKVHRRQIFLYFSH